MPDPLAGLGMLEDSLRRSARSPKGHGAATHSREMRELPPAPGMTVCSWTSMSEQRACRCCYSRSREALGVDYTYSFGRTLRVSPGDREYRAAGMGRKQERMRWEIRR